MINLFQELRRDLSLTCLFTSHDLSIVRHVGDRAAVMYLGRVVEIASTKAICEQPRHPYAKALLASIPKLVLDSEELVAFEPIKGEIPSTLAPPRGCHFAPRCPLAAQRCSVERPELKNHEREQRRRLPLRRSLKRRRRPRTTERCLSRRTSNRYLSL